MHILGACGDRPRFVSDYLSITSLMIYLTLCNVQPCYPQPKPLSSIQLETLSPVDSDNLYMPSMAETKESSSPPCDETIKSHQAMDKNLLRDHGDKS